MTVYTLCSFYCKSNYIIIFISVVHTGQHSVLTVHEITKSYEVTEWQWWWIHQIQVLQKQASKFGLSCHVFTAVILTKVQPFNIHYRYLQENGFCKSITLGKHWSSHTTFVPVKDQILLPETIETSFLPIGWLAFVIPVPYIYV